jgi:hypothetical protein
MVEDTNTHAAESAQDDRRFHVLAPSRDEIEFLKSG